MVCGEVVPPTTRLRLTCSAECKRLHRNQLDRGYYAAGLDREHKERQHGSAYFGELRCSVDDCDRKYYAKGLCNMHYARVRRAAMTSAKRTTLLTEGALSAQSVDMTPETEARLKAASPAERNRAILDAHNEGASNYLIARIVGLSESGVRKIIKENPE